MRIRQLGAVKRYKKFSLRKDGSIFNFALIVAINQDMDDKIGVKAQVVPTDVNQFLPVELRFRLWSRGNLLQDLHIQDQTSALYLPYFRGIRGETFKIEVQLIQESFQVSFKI